MLANNEVGTIQPLAAIAEVAHSHGVPLHTDAVQGAASLDLNVDRLGVDLLSLSAHKFSGPKGVGLLYVRRGTPLLPQQQGGGQERGMRAGTENTAGIVGAVEALRIACDERAAYVEHCSVLRDHLIESVLAHVEDTIVTGHPTERLANNASFAFRGADGEALLMALDAEGIAASAGSACTSGTLDVSHVLRAMGIDDEVGGGSLRLTLGMDNAQEDVDRVLEVLPAIVERARAARRMSVG
jgi:cysteine desulfurase